jgi:hypothetical protein
LRIGGSGDFSGAGVVSIREGDTVGRGVSHGGGLGIGEVEPRLVFPVEAFSELQLDVMAEAVDTACSI